jgi:hypothetical protein
VELGRNTYLSVCATTIEKPESVGLKEPPMAKAKIDDSFLIFRVLHVITKT